MLAARSFFHLAPNRIPEMHASSTRGINNLSNVGFATSSVEVADAEKI